jgi:GTPase SAR1 family protein
MDDFLRDAGQSYKICLVGAPRTGKTSFMKRTVANAFDETYRQSTGVEILQKEYFDSLKYE